MGTLRQWWNAFVVTIVEAIMVVWWRLRRQPKRAHATVHAANDKRKELKHVARIKAITARHDEWEAKARLAGIVNIKDDAQRRAELLKMYEDLS